MLPMTASNTQFKPLLPSKNGVGPSYTTLPEGAWLTIADFLAHRFPRIALAEWIARMQQGDVLDERGTPLTPDSTYRSHQKIYYYRDLPPEKRIPFDETVLYQDDTIVVADKPHFLPVTPSGRFLQETLLVRLKRKLGIDTLSPMHRIDQDTAGLVLFSIQPTMRNAYQALFRQRTVEKRYEAIAPWRKDLTMPITIHNRLAQGSSFMQMRVEEGKPNAETSIDLLEKKDDLARYTLRPITGQKHQLRVQMAMLGIPIVNDRIYPHLHPEIPYGETPDYSKPLQLLAKSITFTDPVSGQLRQFESLQCLNL